MARGLGQSRANSQVSASRGLAQHTVAALTLHGLNPNPRAEPRQEGSKEPSSHEGTSKICHSGRGEELEHPVCGEPWLQGNTSRATSSVGGLELSPERGSDRCPTVTRQVRNSDRTLLTSTSSPQSHVADPKAWCQTLPLGVTSPGVSHTVPSSPHVVGCDTHTAFLTAARNTPTCTGCERSRVL